MAEVYAALIINGRRKFEKVPEKLQDAVKEILNEQGYDTDGNKLEK